MNKEELNKIKQSFYTAVVDNDLESAKNIYSENYAVLDKEFLINCFSYAINYDNYEMAKYIIDINPEIIGGENKEHVYNLVNLLSGIYGKEILNVLQNNGGSIDDILLSGYDDNRTVDECAEEIYKNAKLNAKL